MILSCCTVEYIACCIALLKYIRYLYALNIILCNLLHVVFGQKNIKIKIHTYTYYTSKCINKYIYIINCKNNIILVYINIKKNN